MNPSDAVNAAGDAIVVASVVKALESEVAKALYDDSRPAVQQLGKAAADLLAIARIPLQVARAYTERWVLSVARAMEQVPEAHRQQPAASIAGPIYENVKYVEEGNPLLSLYERLLARAMDKQRVEEAHPAFPNLIAQLSADEALLLYFASKRVLQSTLEYDNHPFGTPEISRVSSTSTSLPTSRFLFPQNVVMYIEHLRALNLLEVENLESSNEERKDHAGRDYYRVRVVQEFRLTRMGALFARACIPEQWPFPEPVETEHEAP